MRPTPGHKRKRAIELLKQSISVRKVSKRCGLSATTVQRIRAAYVATPNLNRGGRPAKLSAADKRFCIRAITSGGLDTSVAVKQKLQTELDIVVSAQTVRNTLRQAGLASHTKLSKPHLSAKNVRARLAFARAHQAWTVDDWRRVIWSDETKINRFGSDGQCWYWKRDDEQLQPRHVKQTVKHGGGSIMAWGCFTASGPGFVCQIQGRMDQILYRSILEDELLQTIAYYGLDAKQVIFQQDNDPKHTSRSVQNWLSEQPFKVLEWPSQSPDLNPIEHLWAVVKQRLNRFDRPPSGMLELWERFQLVWNAIDKDLCERLVASMPARMKAVIRSRGRWTKY